MDICDNSSQSTCPSLWDLRQGSGQPDWLCVCSAFGSQENARRDATTPPQHKQGHTHLHMRPAQACHSLLSLATLVLERVQGGIVPSSSAFTPSGSPTPEKVQLRGPQGHTGNALCAPGQPGYFLS